MKINKSNSGVSLIIAILFVSFFLLALASLGEAQLKTLSNIRNRELDGKLFYLAESAAELAASWAAAPDRVGANIKDDAALMAPLIELAEDLLNISNCENTDNDNATVGPLCVGVEVKGSEGAAKSFDDSTGTWNAFSAPIRGTGNAGINCSQKNAPDNLDDPCNWNRLKVGQAVEIPLYYTDSAGAVVKAIGSGKKFRLRIRTLCDPEKENSVTSKPYAAGDSCAAVDRVDLYPLVSSEPGAAYLDPKKDKVLVQWTITEGADGGGSTLIASDKKVPSGLRNELSTENTEISAGRIQDSKSSSDSGALQDFNILFQNHKGKEINSSGGSGTPIIDSFSSTQPILRLTFVSRPKRNKVDNVPYDDPNDTNDIPKANDTAYDLPYLEYQILSSSQFADSKSVIIGKAEFGDFKKEYRSEKERPATLGGFVLESF